jgi:hypothetical protein
VDGGDRADHENRGASGRDARHATRQRGFSIAIPRFIRAQPELSVHPIDQVPFGWNVANGDFDDAGWQVFYWEAF